MACEACRRDIRIAARGLCGACYSRWQRTGSTEPAKRRQRARCQLDDCASPAVSHGLCDKHRQRLRKHGHTRSTRPDSWGAISKHPLGHTWKYMHRYRGRMKIAPEWRSDFLQFVLDVGERPSPVHKLFAADETKPLGPQNFVWKRAITERVEGEDEKTLAARRQRIYRSVRQEAYHGYELKRRFGINKAEYEKLMAEQNHCCAICKKPERLILNGKQASLAVDHCHNKGFVRGLLCSKCNQGIGCFEDNVEYLKRAIEYLEWPARLL